MAAEYATLPAELDTFIGREPELAEARSKLQTNRLVTLIGPPGVGKTRLAGHLITTDRPAFDDVYFANLIDVSAGDVPNTVANALGILDNRPTDQAAEGLVAFVREHENMLLVLDNCEELVEPVRALVSALLHAAPGMRILTTSRVKLAARGEKVIRVPTLSIDDAVRLLIDRGAAVRPEWTAALRDHADLPAADMTAARQVCQMLDGLPLAIEMVASWLDVISIQETVTHLSDRFRLLVAEESDQPNHRSMRAALDSSYALLSPSAQRMWQAAATFVGGFDKATFVGGFDLAAAQAVATAAGIEQDRVLAALTSLVRHSVLGTETRDGRTRYTMLETSRVYGRHQTPVDDVPVLRQAHADHFFELVTAAEADWLSAREIDWMHRLISESPNLRLALGHFRHHSQHQRALLFVINSAKTMFQIFAGRIDEARRWLASVLADYPDEDELLVVGYALSAWLALVQGAGEEWSPLLERSRQAARAVGCLNASPVLLFAEANRVFLTEPNRTKARESITMFMQAADLAAAEGQRGPHCMGVMFSAFAACFLGDRATATRQTQELVALSEATEAPWAIAWAQWTRALLELIHCDDLYAAMSWVQQALEMAWSQGDTWLPAWALWLAACIAARLGQAEQAAFLFGGAQQLQRLSRALIERLLPWWQLHQQAQKIVHAALGVDKVDELMRQGESASIDELKKHGLQPLQRPHPTDEASEPAPVLGGLAPREHQVAEYVVRGWKNRQIAEELGISVRTVEVYVASLIKKLDAGGRVGVAMRFTALLKQTPPALKQ